MKHVQVRSHDGVLLDGWISFPDLPPGVRAPVLLISTPYLATVMMHPAFGPLVLRHPASDLKVGGSISDTGETGGWWDDDGQMQFDRSINGLGVLPIHWIKRGFILANFSIRGAGHSGGCFDTGGFAEQLDQKVLVEWLAGYLPDGSRSPAARWSNGRVGMGGLSYPGWTTWQAAVQAPRGLKAIASIAPITDYYDYLYTRQGARIVPTFYIVPPFYEQYSNPALLGDPARTPGDLGARAGCPRPGQNSSEIYGALATGQRSKAFFEERNLMPRVRNVTAAVLQVQGFADPGHFTQDRVLTAALDPSTPRRELRGWWPHEHPEETVPLHAPAAWRARSWEAIVTGWFEYWLKGIGPRPRLGVVDHKDQAGRWHQSIAWPPPESRKASLFLADGSLASTPADGTVSFRSAPPPHETTSLSWEMGLGAPGGASLCGTPSGTPQVNAVYMTEASADIVISGNPYAKVRVASDLPGGVVSVDLYDVAPEFRCDGSGPPTGITWLAAGGADLEYYQTKYEPAPFPVNTPVTIRIDLTDVTAAIPAGHRLAVVLGHGEIAERLAQPGRYPTITVYPQSRVVLPLMDGRRAGAE